MIAQEIIEIIKEVLEKDERVKGCRKYRTDRALQIQLYDGKNFNLCVIELTEKDYILKKM